MHHRQAWLHHYHRRARGPAGRRPPGPGPPSLACWLQATRPRWSARSAASCAGATAGAPTPATRPDPEPGRPLTRPFQHMRTGQNAASVLGCPAAGTRARPNRLYMLCDVPRYFADPDAGTGADTTCEAARISVVRIWAQGDSCAAMSQRMTDYYNQLLRDRHDYPAVLDWPSDRRSKPCAFVKVIVPVSAAFLPGRRGPKFRQGSSIDDASRD